MADDTTPITLGLVLKVGALIAMLAGAVNYVVAPIADQTRKSAIVTQSVTEIDSRKGFCEEWDFAASEERSLTPRERFDLVHNCKAQADTFQGLKDKLEEAK